MTKEQELLESIIKAIVINPEKVKTTRFVDNMGVLLEVRVADEDVGRIIGRSGAIFKAIKKVMLSVGYSSGARISVRLIAPERKER